MEPETARIILYVATAIAAIIWMAGFQFLLATARARRLADNAGVEAPGPAGHNMIYGSAEVDGQAAELATKAAAALAKDALGPLGQIKITERKDDRVVFERVGP